MLILLLGLKSSIQSQVNLYADLVMTPIMAYTIDQRGSNIPTHFLIANGVKANIGTEIGLLINVFSTSNESAFLTAGFSYHFLGLDYNSPIINLAEQRVSNHRHSRFFIGAKFLPLHNMKFMSVSMSLGYGTIFANYASKNINGKVKARTGDVSISFAFGLNKFML